MHNIAPLCFVTVGTQLPFTRLLDYVKQWAESQTHKPTIYAQTGEKSRRYSFTREETHIDCKEYYEWLDKADIVIAHAGMGTLIEAISLNKLVLIVPRMRARGEHRNDHQLATADRFDGIRNVEIAYSQDDFNKSLMRLLQREQSSTSQGETLLNNKPNPLGRTIDVWLSKL